MKRKVPTKVPISHPSAEKVNADAIIFDIDNVLVDTRHSYLEAIRNTVELYLTHGPIPFFSRSAGGKFPSLITPEDVDQFKLLGGLNDDWDCCYGLLAAVGGDWAAVRTDELCAAVLGARAALTGFPIPSVRRVTAVANTVENNGAPAPWALRTGWP